MADLSRLVLSVAVGGFNFHLPATGRVGEGKLWAYTLKIKE